MKLVSFIDNVTMLFGKSTSTTTVAFEPFRPYIISDHHLELFAADPNIRPLFFKTAEMDPRTPNFNAAVGQRNRVFFYNGSGGYGDQVLAWPVAKYLAKLGYQVDVYADPGNESCWWMQPWLNVVSNLPVQKAVWDRYNAFCIFESVGNKDEHADQEHPVDAMLRKIGIDPASVPPDEKVVRPEFTFIEKNNARSFLAKMNVSQPRFAFVQLAASTPLRSVAPEDATRYLTALATAYPDIAWISLTDQHQNVAYRIAIQTSGMSNLYAFTFAKLRDLWAAMAHAAVVVSTDTMSVHVAGSLGVPCVGLWGPVNPLARMKYYADHTPLFNPQVCPYSPCFHATSPNLPPYCPPENPPAKTCAVVRSITPEKVVESVRKHVA